jgi:uncharacterized NAD-dependent epimerase/dehydratase family protein
MGPLSPLKSRTSPCGSAGHAPLRHRARPDHLRVSAESTSWTRVRGRSRGRAERRPAARACIVRLDMRETAAILTLDRFDTSDAKTAHGLVRGPSRYEIVAVLDTSCAGRDAGDVLDGHPRGIPVLVSLDALLETGVRPTWCVVGVATSGGVLPDSLRAPLLEALARGIGVVSGLHELLSEDADFADAAARGGARIVDIRRPKRRAELHFWTGAIQAVRTPRLALLGTDCALGKRTTSQVLAAALRARGVATEVIYTGQTGWLQGCEYGFVLDATPNDFVSGELEHALVRADHERSPDLLVLEGQSALRNPSGPCGAELMLSGGARGVILQHAPARHYFEDQEHLGNLIPSLKSELALIELYGSRVLGIALNHERLDERARAEAQGRIAHETGLPAVYPLLDPLEPLLDVVVEYMASEARR